MPKRTLWRSKSEANSEVSETLNGSHRRPPQMKVSLRGLCHLPTDPPLSPASRFFLFFLFFFPISLALPMSPAGLCFQMQLGRGVRGRGLGPEDPRGAFPTLIILGFCNSVIQGFAGAEFPQKLPAHQKHFSQTRFQPYFDALSPPKHPFLCRP